MLGYGQAASGFCFQQRLGRNQHALMNVLDRTCAIDNDKPFGLSCGKIEESRVDCLVVVFRAAAYGVGLSCVSLGQPVCDIVGTCIQHYCKVGKQAAAADVMQLPNGAIAKIPAFSLVSAARIQETIADDPMAVIYRRADFSGDMVCAGSGKEQGFRFACPAFAGRGQQERADRFSTRRSTWLARENDGLTVFAKVFRQQVGLCGFIIFGVPCVNA